MVRLFGRKQKGKQIRLAVEGMTCEHCEMRVQKALAGVEGVQEAQVDLAHKEAIVTVDPGQEVEVEALVAAVEAAGYEARPAEE